MSGSKQPTRIRVGCAVFEDQLYSVTGTPNNCRFIVVGLHETIPHRFAGSSRPGGSGEEFGTSEMMLRSHRKMTLELTHPENCTIWYMNKAIYKKHHFCHHHKLGDFVVFTCSMHLRQVQV